jgi:hypothetical protein
MAILYVTTGAWGVGTGSPLAAADVDNNFYELDQRVEALETGGVQPNNIANITLVGSQMTIIMEDASIFGPFTVPIAMLHWRGDWVEDEDYNELDIIFVAGQGTYLVLRDHTSDPYAFDPAAVDEEANPLYFLLFAVPNFDPATFNLESLGNVAAADPLDGMFLEWSIGDQLWTAVPHRESIHYFLAGAVPDSTVLSRWVSDGNYYIPELEGISAGYVPVSPTDTVDVELHKNGVQFGTMSFSNSELLAAPFLTGDPVDFIYGDTLEIVSPSNAVADGLEDVSLTIILYRGILPV